MSNNIIVFTLHKSASMFIHQQCAMLCKLAGIPHYSPNSPVNAVPEPRFLDKDFWRSKQGCIAPVRFYVDVPNLDDFQVILHLRDPRDVLTSMFYSYCYIHNGEIAANTGYRKEVAEAGIDKFVLGKSTDMSKNYRGGYGTGRPLEDKIGNMPDRYRSYIDNVVGKPNVTLVAYEEMVTDYRAWLKKFISPFPIASKDEIVSQMVAMSSQFFPERNEDKMTHVRHVTPGDHLNKLQPSTIKQLDEIYGDILDALGYERFEAD